MEERYKKIEIELDIKKIDFKKCNFFKDVKYVHFSK